MALVLEGAYDAHLRDSSGPEAGRNARRGSDEAMGQASVSVSIL